MIEMVNFCSGHGIVVAKTLYLASLYSVVRLSTFYSIANGFINFVESYLKLSHRLMIWFPEFEQHILDRQRRR